MISIQPFHTKNLKVTIDIIHATVKKCYPEFYSPQVIDFFLEYHNKESLLKKHETGEVYNIVTDSKIVGSGYLVENELGGLYILPEFQGLGLGLKMMNYLLKRAQSQNLSKVWLDATPNSKNFYAKHGFKLIQEETLMVEEKYPLPYFVMEYYF